MLKYAIGDDCGIEPRVARFNLKIKSLTIHVVARRYIIFRDQAIALHPGDQAKCLFGRQ